jgi:hypothetical protein
MSLNQKENDKSQVLPPFLQTLTEKKENDKSQVLPPFLQTLTQKDIKSEDSKNVESLMTPLVSTTPPTMSEEIEITGTINHGYSLRHAFQIIGMLCTEATLVFSNRGIFLTQVGCEKSSQEADLLMCLAITCGEILNYKFKYIDSKGVSRDSIGFGVSITDVMLPFSSCTKKQSFIFQIVDRTQMICRVCDAKSDNTSQSASFIRFKEIQNETTYEQPQFKRGEDDPNFSIQTSEFANICKNIAKNKGKNIIITGYKKGFKIEGVRTDKHTAYVSVHGDPTIPIATAKVIPAKTNETATKVVNTACNIVGEITGTSIPIDMKNSAINITSSILKLIPQCNEVIIRFGPKILKAFSKMTQLCPDGITKLFFEYDQENRRQLPLKITTPIGNYGRLTIYVKDNPNS